MNSKARTFFAGITCNVFILLFATTAWGFQGFNESGNGVPSCSSCHTAFASAQGAHGAHAGLANGCNDCHGGSFNNNPPLDNCVQCHGRAEDAGFDSEGSGIGRGLRLHHVTVGAAACDSCHRDARSATSVGENVLPSFYAAAGAAGLDSCDGSEEQFASLTASLDNDGDGLTDGNDPDCATNVPPTANPNGPYNAVAGTAIVFSSDGSTDSDGTIVSFAWDFGDGNTGSGASPTHTYQGDGTFTVSLTVTDDRGATGSASTTATITPAPIPPTADAGGPYSGLVGTPVSFDGAASGDADGTVVAYAWDFGDGGVASEQSPTHSYSVDGSFTVTLTVTDNDGLTGTDTTTATINPAGGNTPPIADANGPYSGTEGVAVQFSSSGSGDPDGTIAAYAWNFGDGNTSTSANPSHSYIAAGTYTVTLSVTDNSGDSSMDTTSAVIEAVIVNSPPSADANGPYSGYVGDSIAFDGSNSTDPNGVIVAYDWDFGDGTTVADAGPTPTHVYAAAGEYTVTLTVTDDAGDSDSATTTVTLSERGAAMDGEEQYNNYCASCHGDPWAGRPVDAALAGVHRVAGARSCTIEASIFGTSVFPNGAPGMEFLQALISDGTIDAQQLADYLNSQSVSGEQRYVAACAGCHGNDGRGGRTREGVLGESAHETREAIREEQAMRFLNCVPDSDIDAITQFLGGSTGGDGGSDDDDDEVAKKGGGSSGWLWLLLLAAVGRRRWYRFMGHHR